MKLIILSLIILTVKYAAKDEKHLSIVKVRAVVELAQGLTGMDEHVHAVDGDERNHTQSSGAQSQSRAHQSTEEFFIRPSFMLGKLAKITPNGHWALGMPTL